MKKTRNRTIDFNITAPKISLYQMFEYIYARLDVSHFNDPRINEFSRTLFLELKKQTKRFKI